jgi:hypothetical protein
MGEDESLFFEGIAEDIELKMERRDKTDEKFVTRYALEYVWNDDRLTKFGLLVSLSRAGSDITIETLRTNLLQTLSILVFMKWRQWDKFLSLFIYHGNLEKRGDATIMQHTQVDLEKDDFLGSKKSAADFMMFRSSFVPIDIWEGMVKTYKKDRRLPFLEPENGVAVELGRGGFGTVTKVEIARSQYYREGIPQPVRFL